MILPGCENPRNCLDPDMMKMRWCLSTTESPEYVLPIAPYTSITLGSPYTRRHSLTMYLEAVSEWTQRFTWRPGSSELRHTLRGCDRASVEMHLEAEIKWTQRFRWRPWWSEFADAFGGCDRASLEMHFDAVIERGWRCNWRLRLSELRDALGGRDWASLEMRLQAMIERDWRSTWKRSIWREARRQLRLYS